jgi:hypothetical protein
MDIQKEDKAKYETIDAPLEFLNFLNTKNGVLCVPEPKFREYTGSVLKPDTFSFAKWFKKNHPEITIDVGNASAKVGLRSNDFWLPLVYLANDVSLQIYLNIVANYIYDMARGALRHDKKSVHLSVIHKSESGDIKEFLYDGSLEGLKNTIKKIDINKLMDK